VASGRSLDGACCLNFDQEDYRAVSPVFDAHIFQRILQNR
jgi:hypothetical protein